MDPLRNGKALVDLRVLDDDAERIPGAPAVSGEDPDAGFVADLPPTRKLIVYGRHALPTAVRQFEGEVAVLEGGYEAVAAEILTAPVLGSDPPPVEIKDFRLRSALHAHFTGSALQDAPPPPRPKTQIRRAGKKEGGC